MNQTTIEILSEIKSCFPHLETQLDFLVNVFGERRQKPFGSLFIYGQPGTGKTSFVQTFLCRLSLPHAFVNLVDCFSPQILFEEILNQLSGVVPRPANFFAKYASCSSLADFVPLFVAARKDARIAEAETVYVVLDKAKWLREMPHNVLGSFLRLQELTKTNVCVVFISQLPWENFHQQTGTADPLCLHFPDLTRSQLVDVLSLDRPLQFQPKFYETFVQLVLSVFYTKCRDLRELKYLCRLHFPKYIEPISSGEAKAEESQKLWRQIQPVLRESIQSLYLREVSSSQWDLQSLATEKSADEESEETNVSNPSSSSSYVRSRLNVELPFFSKFLLSAAYVASYNPASTDRRFFCKNPGKLRKSLKLMKKTKEKRRQTTAQILGPKPFPLDRLLAIFYSIVDQRVPPSANILSQVSSLVSLKLLAHSGVQAGDRLDALKYKCCVSLDFVRGVAKTIHFDIDHFLYDLL